MLAREEAAEIAAEASAASTAALAGQAAAATSKRAGMQVPPPRATVTMPGEVVSFFNGVSVAQLALQSDAHADRKSFMNWRSSEGVYVERGKLKSNQLKYAWRWINISQIPFKFFRCVCSCADEWLQHLPLPTQPTP